MSEYIQDTHPTDNKPKQVRGVITTIAHWEDEQKNWVLEENQKIDCNIMDWKEIEDAT